MENIYLNENDIKQVFFQSNMDDENGYDLDELLDFADKVIMAAEAVIARRERELCIEFVESLNTQVASALKDKRGPL
jgi:cell division septum initiation protein DivIVA